LGVAVAQVVGLGTVFACARSAIDVLRSKRNAHLECPEIGAISSGMTLAPAWSMKSLSNLMVLVSVLGLAACGGSDGSGGGAAGAGASGGVGGASGGSGGAGATGTGGVGTGGTTSDAVWDDGPVGHVYVFADSLYDLDATDGRVLRQLPTTNIDETMQADADHAYFVRDDAQGDPRVFQLGTSGDEVTQLSAVKNELLGVYAGELVGQLDGNKLVRIVLATGVDTQIPLPVGLNCENGSIFEHTLYLACVQNTTTGTDAGMLTYDLDSGELGQFVVVKSGVASFAAASNVTGTPSGALFALYEGVVDGTRTAYKITGTTVSAGTPIPGTANNLDQQAAIGNMVYLALNPDGVILPFDVSTMTAGTPIAYEHPRLLRAGGGFLWAGGSDGKLAKINPTTGDVKFRQFPQPGGDVDAFAFGGE
jgi:hypothetical protein